MKRSSFALNMVPVTNVSLCRGRAVGRIAQELDHRMHARRRLELHKLNGDVVTPKAVNEAPAVCEIELLHDVVLHLAGGGGGQLVGV